MTNLPARAAHHRGPHVGAPNPYPAVADSFPFSDTADPWVEELEAENADEWEDDGPLASGRHW